MNTDVVDQVIAQTEAAPVEEVVTEEVFATEEEVSTKQPSEPEEAVKQEEDVLFPKKAVNAISRRDKQIGKLRAELQQEKQELERLRAAQEEAAKPAAPQELQEDDFENYGDYLKALAIQAGQGEQKPEGEKPEMSPEEMQAKALEDAKEQLHYQQREQFVAEQANKAIEANPEMENLLTENLDILDNFPPSVEKAFLDANNAPMAFYALAKEGRLEELASMPIHRAAMEIARAEVRGEQMVSAQKVSKAPAPISSNKGAATVSKHLDTMSGDDILKAIRK